MNITTKQKAICEQLFHTVYHTDIFCLIQMACVNSKDDSRTYIYIYTYRTQLTSIFEGQPSKTRFFRIKTRGPIRVQEIPSKIMFTQLPTTQKKERQVLHGPYTGPIPSLGEYFPPPAIEHTIPEPKKLE